MQVHIWQKGTSVIALMVKKFENGFWHDGASIVALVVKKINLQSGSLYEGTSMIALNVK